MTAKQQRLRKEIEALSKEIEPERDLWSGIEHSIVDGQQQETKAWHSKLAIAASILVVAFVGLLSYQGGKNTQSIQIAEQLSQEYQAQREALLVSVKDQTAYTENWQQQLDDLDKAASAIKLALEEDPNNPALLKMLKQVYEQQLVLIQRVHAPAWQEI